MKILLLSLDAGGIMHYAIDLANNLGAYNEEIIFIGKEEAKEFLSTNCKFIFINNSKNILYFYSEFKKIFQETKPNIVHFTGYHPAYIFIANYLKRNKIPTVYTIHDAKIHKYNFLKFEGLKKRLIFNKFLNRKLIRSVSKAITLSSYVAGQVSAIYKYEANVILLSQDIGRYHKFNNKIQPLKAEDKIKILFFGSLSKYKGLESLIEAAKILKQKKVKFSLTIAGRSGGGYSLKVPMDLQEEIIFMNRFIKEEEIPFIFNDCDVVIQPYLEASQSGVLPLAFAYRKPVIATNLANFTEIIEDGVNGFLVEKNSPKEIADLIEYLSRNKQKLRSLSYGAYNTYNNKLNWNTIVKKYIKIYSSIYPASPPFIGE